MVCSVPALNRQAEKGMVLIVVLWMVAALSIIVTGVTRSVREEAHILSLERQRVQARGLGDAAIHIVLQGMVAQPTPPIARLTTVDVVYGGVSMAVEIMPLNGLIDINNAPAPLLTSLFAVAGGVSPDEAANLAQATLDTRSRKNGLGAPERFDAKEDLLRVPGIDYTLYAKLSALITADLRSGGKVNPLAAPRSVLVVLASGNAGIAARIASDRSAGKEGIDTTSLDGGGGENTSTSRFRIEARVPLPSGGWLRVSRSVDLNARARDGLPWWTFHSEQGFEPVSSKNS
jgi:general secretion pathway protein K